MDCYEFIWQSDQDGMELRDCYNISKAHWYGGAISKDHKWPLSAATIPVQKFVTGDTTSNDQVQSMIRPTKEDGGIINSKSKQIKLTCEWLYSGRPASLPEVTTCRL